MSATIVELPMGIVIPDTVEELQTMWDAAPMASLLLYTGSGGPALSMQMNWQASDPVVGKNWRGKEKLKGGSVCLDRNMMRLPVATGEIVEQTFEWVCDRTLYGDYWIHVVQPGGLWDRVAFNLYPKGPWMTNCDLLRYKLRFVGT